MACFYGIHAICMEREKAENFEVDFLKNRFLLHTSLLSTPSIEFQIVRRIFKKDILNPKCGVSGELTFIKFSFSCTCCTCLTIQIVFQNSLTPV